MQRRHLWVFTILLGALTTLTTCSGCGAPTATGGLVFKVAAGVDRDDEALIREIARDARRYYEKQLGYGLQGQVVINLDLSDSLSKPAYAAKDVTLYLRNSSWLRMGAFEKQYLVAHELFHAFQFDMAGPNAFATPGWIVEGTADFAAHKYMEAKGELDYSAALDYHKSAMSTSRLGQFVVHDSEYSLAVIGADYLLRQRGLKALTAFFTALQGLPAFEWRPAFETNFGTSADIFIEDFERTHPPVTSCTLTACSSGSRQSKCDEEHSLPRPVQSSSSTSPLVREGARARLHLSLGSRPNLSPLMGTRHAWDRGQQPHP